MEPSPIYCQKCGKPLSNDTLFCGSCGQPVPGVSFFTPPEGAATARPKPARGPRFWFGVISLIGGSLTSCGSLVALAAYLIGGFPGLGGTAAAFEPTPTQIIPTLTVAFQTATFEPSSTPMSTASRTVEVPATFTPGPPSSTPKPQAAARSGSYADDFENVESGWTRLYEDTYNLDYAPDGNYRIELKMPDRMVASEPPLKLEGPFYNMILSVRAKGEVGNGYYGLLCHYQDETNYYRAGIANGYYTISKLVNGSLTYLVDPPWKPILLYEPDDDGYVKLTLACEDGRIQLLIDDVGQEIITDTDLNQGNAALFVSAGNQPNSEGVYMRGYFDDFSVEIP